MRDARREALVYQSRSDSLVLARGWLEENLTGAGAVCPCCGQLARMYRRRLSPTISAALCLIYRATVMNPEEIWVNVPRLLQGTSLGAGGDYAKGVLWGLLESRPETFGSTVGWYRPTETGVSFVLEQVSLPEYLWVYEGVVQAADDRYVTIRESLAGEYDYQELMG